MKFINYLESIAGIEIYPMISLAIFFLFFILLITWTFRVSKKKIEIMKNIPFENSND